MNLIISLLVVGTLLTGCAVFKTPDKTAEAPAVPKDNVESTHAWAADVVKQKRDAEREKFEKALDKSVSGGANNK